MFSTVKFKIQRQKIFVLKVELDTMVPPRNKFPRNELIIMRPSKIELNALRFCCGMGATLVVESSIFILALKIPTKN